MKRVVPILLCMSFILSLCSMTTMATGENEPALLEPSSTGPELPEGSKQLYYMLNSNALTSLDVKALNGGLLDFCYKNENDTLVPIPVDTTFQTLGDLEGVLNYIPNMNRWNWDTAAVAPNKDGFLRATFGGQNYDIFARILPAEFGVYTADTAADDKYVPRIGGKHTVNYNTDGNAVYIISDDSFPINGIGVTGGENKVTCEYINEDKVKLTLVDGFSGSITFTANLTFQISGSAITRDFNITFTDGTSGGGSSTPPQGVQFTETLRAPAHPVAAADKCDGFVQENYLSASFNVRYDGEDKLVYMVPGLLGSMNATFGGSDEWTFSQEELDSGRLINIDRGVGFFLPKDGGGTDRIADPAFIAAIKEKIGNSLRLDVYTYGNKAYPIRAEFPAVYDLSPDTDRSLANVRLKLGMKHRGYYVFRATCTVDGVEKVSEYRLEWRPTIEAVYQFGQDTTVAEINAYLDAYPDYSDYTTLVLKLPAKELYGYIDIPAKAGRSYVELRGAERVNGQPTTILHGGFTTSNFSARAENIAFVGAGRDAAKWPSVNGSAGVNADRPNCAVYDYTVFHGGEPTESGSHCENCTFTGYNTAINTVMRLRTAANCYFVGNDVAMRFNTKVKDGGGDMGGNKFRSNGIAIHFDNLHEDFPTSWFQLRHTVFIDNKIDIQNDLKNGSEKRNIFIPAAYFGYTVNNDTVARECNSGYTVNNDTVAREYNSGKPDVSNSANNRVFAYPQAAQPNDFNKLIYDPAFYVSSKSKGPIFSSNLSASYPLPHNVLSGNAFRILDESTGKIVKVKF